LSDARPEASASGSPPARPPAPRRRSSNAWSVVLATLAFALAFQGARPLWEPDEGRYVTVSLEMLRTGDWWTPRLHHEIPHYSKPPLTYWANAASIGLLGRNEWAARLPAALAFFGTILLVGFMARRLAPGTGLAAPLVYATSLLPFVAANIVTTDTLLGFGIALGVAGFVELAFGHGSPRLARSMLWGGFGLAFLTKGPPGLLPLLAILVYCAFDRGHWRGRRRVASLGAMALFLVFAFGWFLHEIAIRPDLLSYLLGAEVVERVGSAEFRRHSGWRGLFEAYGPVLVAGMLPWAPLALRPRRHAGGDVPLRRPLRFVRVWFLVPLVVFAAAQSRLPLYLLQLAAPAALWIAIRIGPIGRSKRARVAILAWILLLLALKATSGFVPSPRDGRRFAAELLALLPERPSEVAFVETRPRYTLSFYLDCEIERIDLASIQLRPEEPAYRPVAQPLADELAEPESHRVFLVTSGGREAFARELAELGLRSRDAGAIDGFQVYLEPEPIPGAARPETLRRSRRPSRGGG